MNGWFLMLNDDTMFSGLFWFIFLFLFCSIWFFFLFLVQKCITMDWVARYGELANLD